MKKIEVKIMIGISSNQTNETIVKDVIDEFNEMLGESDIVNDLCGLFCVRDVKIIDEKRSKYENEKGEIVEELENDFWNELDEFISM